MTTDNTRKALIDGVKGSYPMTLNILAAVAEDIEADPAVLLDAMVDDGILETSFHPNGSIYYRIPKPHVHEWKVLSMGRGFHMTVDLICNTGDCDERRTVPNTLPIEIPED